MVCQYSNDELAPTFYLTRNLKAQRFLNKFFSIVLFQVGDEYYPGRRRMGDEYVDGMVSFEELQALALSTVHLLILSYIYEV